MRIYIIVDKSYGMIESVWSTLELAKSARLYHANQATKLLEDYDIIEREIDTSSQRKKEK